MKNFNMNDFNNSLNKDGKKGTKKTRTFKMSNDPRREYICSIRTDNLTRNAIKALEVLGKTSNVKATVSMLLNHYVSELTDDEFARVKDALNKINDADLKYHA